MFILWSHRCTQVAGAFLDLPAATSSQLATRCSCPPWWPPRPKSLPAQPTALTHSSSSLSLPSRTACCARCLCALRRWACLPSCCAGSTAATQSERGRG